MDEHLLRKLAADEALEDLGGGRKGVKVSLQFEHRFTETSRQRRGEQLLDRFRRIADEIAASGAAVDLESLSISGQTVKAVLPLDVIDHLEAQLKNENIRVDPLFDRTVAE